MSETLKDLKSELRQIYPELEVIQAKMSSGKATSAEVDDGTKLAKRAEELQDRLKKYEEISGAVEAGRQIKDQPLPGDDRSGKEGIITTPGHVFVNSETFAAYTAMGKQGWSGKVPVKSFGRRIVLRGEEKDRFIARMETKDFGDEGVAVPTFTNTDTVLKPFQRDPDVIRFEEPEILTIRDVMTVLPVSTDTVRHTRYEYTRAAAPQNGRGGLKPYAATEVTATNVPVETIAVLHKVSEQDVDDSPRLIGIINGEMRLDVRVEEERQLLHGDGASGEITGLYGQGVEAMEFARAEVGDSLIDIVRRMRTDLRKRRVNPNAVLIDPLDWENIELAKGAATGNDHYIWGLVSTLRGPMIWSLRVIESDAMENAETGERRILMGDFIRGATLYDRHDVRLAVGFVDDDFARNLRTLRAEERLALGVKRPFAFTWTQTDAGGS